MKVLAGGELQQGAPRLNFFPEADDCQGSIASAVRYAAMHPYIDTAVVGMTTTDELLLNVMAVEGINDGMLSEFQRWTKIVSDKNRGECTRCGLCLDVCPEGINIPKVFRIYDQHRFFGMEGVARFRYSELERDASYCLRCRECQQVCPEKFDIGRSLDSAHSLLRAEMNSVRSSAR